MTGKARRAILPFVSLLGLVLPAQVFGHGVEVYDLSGEDRPVRTVYFKYSTGEPVSFARIKIFPPSTAGKNVEALVSITDRNGIFCFVPDEEGEWRVDMEDGMGHKGSITVGGLSGADGTADSPPAPVKGAGGRPPLIFNILLGLSLLANIFGGWYLSGLKRRKAAGVSGAHK
jgi:nickel transport protein